jgi:hypothetical protein
MSMSSGLGGGFGREFPHIDAHCAMGEARMRVVLEGRAFK